MSSALLSLALIWIGATLLMATLWLVQRRTGNAGIVDAGWAFGLGIAALVHGSLAGDGSFSAWLPALLASAWGFRLAAYLTRDRVIGAEEDGRYQDMRAYWGERADAWLFVFFMGQALLVPLFSVPFLAAVRAGSTMPPGAALVALAVAIWLIAVVGETVADRQLARFRARPDSRGRVCREGLWRFSRHPNYFFEWLHWFAYLALSAGSGWFWVALAGPLLMLLFLFRLTGIPYTEQRAIKTRGAEYREYQRTTSVFVPWFPRTWRLTR